MTAEWQQVRAWLEQVQPLSDAAIAAFTAELREQRFAKGEILTAAGAVQHDMLLILEGVQYSYHLKGDKQHVIAFTYPVEFSGLPESFMSGKPSQYYLEALTDTRALAISRESLERLFTEFRELESLYRKQLEMMLTGILQRHYELLSTTAEERFRDFAKRSPHLFQLVPHKLIASYLRIDATNFSKLYNRIRI